MTDSFVVSARKYRPNSFSELLGQDAISVTLRRAISQNKTAHAYLFCGPRGVGKTSAARIFAKTINCLHPTPEGEACGQCESCKAFEEQRSLNIFELDAASNNSTEDIRRLIDEVSVPPQFGRYKVYIIDEVHMLSQSAFNAFLKTLEEPPSYVVFILATTEKQKILPTILSRCQVYDFKPISVEKIQEQLQKVADSEHIVADKKSLELIAQQADGGMRDALSLFDRLAGFGDGTISYQQTIESLHILNESYYLHFAEYIYNNDVSALLTLLDEVIGKGFDPKTILLGLQDFFRKLLFAADSTTLPLVNLLPEEQQEIKRIALDLGRPFLYQALLKLGEAEKRYRASSAKRLLVEMTLIGFTSISKVVSDMPRTITSSSSSQREQTKPIVVEKKTAPIANQEGTKLRVFSSISSNTKEEEPKRRLGTSILQLKKKNSIESAPSSQTSVSSSIEENKVNPDLKQAIPLNDDTLKQAWIAYADKYIPPTNRIESALIRGREPILVSENKIEVTVGSKAHYEELQKLQPAILNFLKQFFGNAEIILEIAYSEKEEMAMMQSKSEWFASEVSKNPALQELITNLQLREC